VFFRSATLEATFSLTVAAKAFPSIIFADILYCILSSWQESHAHLKERRQCQVERSL
jgi:hypothetical protein